MDPVTNHVQSEVATSLERASARSGRLILAISGGIDSMVLLDASLRTIPLERIVVATFDHGTGEWATEAASFVASRCAAAGVQCISGRATGSLRGEAALRRERWRFLRSVANDLVGVCATAHTRDDQVETVLMRAMRDAGARGLAGLYATSDIVRPLLGVTRAEIGRYADARQVAWMEDPTNSSRHYLRNRVRHDVLPAMRRVCPAIDDELLDLAARAADWRNGVERVVDASLDIRILERGVGLDIPAAKFSQCSKSELGVLWPAIAGRAGLAMDRRGVRRISEFTKDGRVGSRAQLSNGWEVIRSRHAFELRATETRGTTMNEIALSNSTQFGDWRFRSAERFDAANPWFAWLPTDSKLVVRRWQPGDALVVRDDGTTRKVKRLLTKAGVTGHKRAGWPVVLAGDSVVWLPGIRRGVSSSPHPTQAGLPFVCEYVNC